ncbi:amidohydrolase family protein [Flagellimonas meishanensis]|uniref:amidohydrolase family protein n=1 Tax=Flagellimonas meishanensis TaxID=2873264 RepID=UPI001CA7B1A7|nr:amidohydrolase family protein [[Muricauda] meishanensis]
MIKYSLALTFILISSNAPSQEMGFEEYSPKSTLVVSENPKEKAKFTFIDVHSHQFGMATQDLSALIKDMDQLNMGIMVNLSGESGPELRAKLKNVNENYPNRFAIFANVNFGGVGNPNWGEQAAAQLDLDVKSGAKGLKIYKSLGLRNRDVNGNRIAVDDARLDPIWEKCAALGIPVLIHSADPKSFWDPFDKHNERWLELKTRPRRKRSDTDPVPWQQIMDEQHRMFKKHPNTKFINAHMGWYANDLDRLGELMDEMPNMSVGIGAIIAELGRQPRRAKAFFIKYQDRILFGKDAWNPEEFPTYFRVLETADEYFPYYKKYHAFWAMYGLDLPDEVLRKVYYKNALNLIPGLDKSLFEN